MDEKNEFEKNNLVGSNYTYSNKASWDNNDMVDFIQKNTEYYIPKFEKIQDFQKPISWNWASFFFTSFWFLYRKMYSLGFGLIALSFILNFIPIIGSICSLAMPIVLGLYANSLYLKYVEKQLNEVKDLKEDVRHSIVINNGGVNIVLPIVIVIVCSVLSTILA